MSKVALVRCNNYSFKNVKAAIQRGLDLLGGADQFVKEGENVLLKPNWIMAVPPERCATTHPVIFNAICDIFKELNINLSYGDSPGHGTSEDESYEAASITGFLKVAESYGIPLADFINGQDVQVDSHTFHIAKGALQADGIISLPKLKTQGFLKLTGAVKNQMGCIPGRRKGSYHREIQKPADFARMLVALNMFLKPRLYIMDGIMAMEGNGPMNGDPKAMNVLLLSTDPIALDATVCRLVNLNPEFSYTVTLGMQAGHGTYLESEITLLGDPIEDFISYDFNINRNPISNVRGAEVFAFGDDAGVPKPYILEERCQRCGVCVDICPIYPKAINFQEGNNSLPLEYDYTRCIRCYCCQEMCPHGAILLTDTV